jgi:hypothetical protein
MLKLANIFVTLQGVIGVTVTQGNVMSWIEVNCLGRGIAEIHSSDGWVWGLAVDARPKPVMNQQGFVAFLEDLEARRFQFSIAEEAMKQFYQLPNDEFAATDFLRQYGVFREADLKMQPFPKPLQRFWKDAVRQGVTPFALRLSDFWEQHSGFKDVAQIIGLLAKKDSQQLENIERADALGGVLVWNRKIPSHVLGRGALSKEALWSAFHHSIPGAEINLSFKERTVRPQVWVHYALPGVYAHLWSKFVHGQSIGMCARCGRLFVVNRPGKVHCSINCKNAAKQQRYRNNLKSKLQTKSRRGGRR